MKNISSSSHQYSRVTIQSANLKNVFWIIFFDNFCYDSTFDRAYRWNKFFFWPCFLEI
jgi:hypothetical protein